MAATLNEFVIKGSCIFLEGNATKSNKDKFNTIGCYYSSLAGFKSASIRDFNNLRTREGAKCFKALTPKEEDALKLLQRNTDPSISLEENFIKILTMNFIRKQAKAIDNITLEGLNANPLLCRALKLNTPEEFVKFYAYSALSRSIVTSMGYLVQDLLLYSNDCVFDGKDYKEGSKTKWDIVVERVNSVRSYIEVKSGPNDMDAAQIKHYAEEIEAVERTGNKAFIGITYGKKDNESVTFGLLETYLEDWRDKTLIGKELWDYISDNSSYHVILMDTIQETSEAFLGDASLIEKIDQKIELLLIDFERDYGTMESFYNSLW